MGSPSHHRLRPFIFLVVTVAAATLFLDARVLWWTGTSQQKLARETPRIPNVLVAGVQKGATTSLFDFLALRKQLFCTPQVFRNDPEYYWKEVHFFDHNHRFSKGLAFYQQRFSHCGYKTFVIDATPNYVLFPERIRQIYDEQGTADSLKIIFSLREPVSREISDYNREVRKWQREFKSWFWFDKVPMGYLRTFEQYMNRKYVPKMGALSYEHSVYEPLLKRWFEMFDRKQILVLSFDELVNNATAALERIHQFLEITEPSLEFYFPHDNPMQSSASTPPCSVQRKYAEMFEPFNLKLYAFLDQHPGPEMEQYPFPRFEFRCED